MGWEGTVYENDPDDSGGETKFGIDKASHPKENIRTLTRERAKEIYWEEYWQRVRAEQLCFGVGEVVADIAVNNGAVRAGKWLQEACGAASDGSIGPRTLLAASLLNPNTLIMALLHRREIFYRSIARGAQAKFLRGWLNRNADLGKFVGI